LKGEKNGIMEEPMLHAWMQEPASGEAQGRWVSEETWPPLRLVEDGYVLGDGTLADGAAPEHELIVSSPESTGLDAGAWCPWSDSELAGDQARDDELSLAFTSEPLEQTVEILGAPVLTVEIAADQERALLAVRLCDVAPDGSSALVTRGLLNLTHRAGSVHPQTLETGRRERIRMPLEAIAYAFPCGHRIRVAVSSSYWPWAWPSPRRAEVTLFTGATSRLELPVRPRRRPDRAPVSLLPPPALGDGHGSSVRRVFQEDTSGHHVVEVERSRGRRFVLPGTLEIEGVQTDVFEIADGDPLSAQVECRRRMGMARDGWSAHVEAAARMSSDAESFLLVHQIDAYENGELVFSRSRTLSLPRDLA
jgi:uncharacterized protein